MISEDLHIFLGKIANYLKRKELTKVPDALTGKQGDAEDNISTAPSAIDKDEELPKGSGVFTM